MLIELKLAFSEHLGIRRRQHNINPAELAKRLRSSPSRVAKMETADESVSLDLLVRGLAVLGATREEIGRIASESQ